MSGFGFGFVLQGVWWSKIVLCSIVFVLRPVHLTCLPCVFHRNCCASSISILGLAHKTPLSGHLWVRKTHVRMLRNFFWLGLKGDMVQFCKTCQTCQVAGKPNQVIPLVLSNTGDMRTVRVSLGRLRGSASPNKVR